MKGGYHQATLLTCESNRSVGSPAEGYDVNAFAHNAGAWGHPKDLSEPLLDREHGAP